MPVAPEKTFRAQQVIVFLGLLLNALTRTVSIPLEKRDKALEQIEFFLVKKKVTVLQIQQLAGILNFICRAVVPGRAFTRRLYNKTDNLKQHYHVRVDGEMKADLTMWSRFLNMSHSVAMCRPFVDFSKVVVAEEIQCTSDASSRIGFGCTYKHWFTRGVWPIDVRKRDDISINWMELYALTVATYIFAPLLKNRRVTIFCDNTSCCGHGQQQFIQIQSLHDSD